MKKFFKIFKAGKYPQGNVTKEDIAEIANSYNRDYHEAPLTILHDDKSPAYAVVDELIADNENLLASFTDISEDAYEMNKKYKRPSIEIANYEGKKYCRAITLTNFPQVKGLDKIKFEENSSLFFTEGLTLNLSKGTIMFNENLIKLAETLSITVSDYNSEGDLIQAAQEKIDTLKSELGEVTKKVTSLSLNVPKFDEAGITIEIYNELKTKLDSALKDKEEAEKLVQQYNEKRIDDLITFAVKEKKFLPSQTESLKKFAQLDFDNAKKFIDALPEKPLNNPLPKLKPDGKEYTYEEVIKDPSLMKNFSEDELAVLKNNSKIFN
jgi:hypothetical protein